MKTRHINVLTESALISRRGWIIIGVMSILFALAVGSSIYYRVAYVHERSPQATYPLQIWASGDIVSSKDLLFSFHSVRTSVQDAKGFWELPANHRYLMVNVSIKNLQPSEYQLSPIRLMHLEDSAGTSYPVTSSPVIQSSIGGPVRSGETAKGEVGFTVPTSFHSGYFVYDPNIVNSHVIRVWFETGE